MNVHEKINYTYIKNKLIYEFLPNRCILFFLYIEQRDLSSSTQRRHQLEPFESEDHTTYPHSIGSHLSTIHRE